MHPLRLPAPPDQRPRCSGLGDVRLGMPQDASHDFFIGTQLVQVGGNVAPESVPAIPWQASKPRPPEDHGMGYGKTRDAMSLFRFVQGHRSLVVASIGVLWLRDKSSLVLLACPSHALPVALVKHQASTRVLHGRAILVQDLGQYCWSPERIVTEIAIFSLHIIPTLRSSLYGFKNWLCSRICG
jgi:hypothetical protein